MTLHILLTTELKKSKPANCRVTNRYGNIIVQFKNGDSVAGLNCIIEGEKEEIKNWLISYKKLLIGVGSPRFEKFENLKIRKHP